MIDSNNVRAGAAENDFSLMSGGSSDEGAFRIQHSSAQGSDSEFVLWLDSSEQQLSALPQLLLISIGQLSSSA